MAEGFDIEMKTQEVEEYFSKLSNKDLVRGIITYALLQGGWALKRIAEQGFRRKLGEAADHPSKYNGGRPFYDSISVSKNDGDVKVSMLNNDYRMKWFETGTVERYVGQKKHTDYSRKKKIYTKNTGKANYRGSISKDKYGGWFASARRDGESEVMGTIIRSIDNAMQKIERGEL